MENRADVSEGSNTAAAGPVGSRDSASYPESEAKTVKSKSSVVTVIVSSVSGGLDFELTPWRLTAGVKEDEGENDKDVKEVHEADNGGGDAGKGWKEYRGNCGTVSEMRDRFHTGFEAAFDKLGQWVGRRPVLTIVAALMLVVVCSSGVVKLQQENRIEVLWVPDDTQAKHDRQFVQETYPTAPDIHQVLLTTNPQGGNVLLPSTLIWAQKMHQRITNLEVSAIVEGHECTFKYKDICEKQGSNCWHMSVLHAVGYDSRSVSDSEGIIKQLNTAAAQLTSRYPIRIEDMLGGIQRDSSGAVTQATAAAFTYFIRRTNQTDNDSDPRCENLQMADAWQTTFLHEMEKIQDEGKQAGLTVDYISQGSWDLAVQNSINSEMWLLYIAAVLVLGYTVAMMSTWGDGLVGTRFVLSVLGITCIGLSIAASIGLCSYFGLPFSSLMGLMPFLLLGTGVDNMFVIVNGFDKSSEDLEIPQRLGYAMAMSGTSITVTSATNLFAFAIGSQTSLPVLRDFALYAVVGIFCNYVLQITLFPALLVMDSRRRKAKRFDIFMCFKRHKETVQSNPSNCFVGVCPSNGFLGAVMKKLGKVLTKKWAKALVIIAFAGLAAIGVWGITRITVESDLNNFVPPDSHIIDFDATRDEFFPETGDRTAVYIQDADFSSPATWARMHNMTASFRKDLYVETGSVQCWFESFLSSANATGEVNSTNFYSKVKEWMEIDPLLTGSVAYSADIVWSEDGEKITTSRVNGNHIKLHKAKEKVTAMDSLRSVVVFPEEDQSQHSSADFVYSDHYLIYEQYKIMGREALLNILLALAMVLTVVAGLFMNLRASLMTWFNIVLAIVELIGFLSLWGFNMDTSLVIFVVVAMGLVVDYSAHIVHGFLKTEGDLDERLVEVLEKIGPAVFNAAVSTLVAVVLLAFSKLYVFKLFFRTFLLCVIFGLLHGIILLPVCLSIMGPEPRTESKSQNGEKPQTNGEPETVPSPKSER